MSLAETPTLAGAGRRRGRIRSTWTRPLPVIGLVIIVAWLSVALAAPLLVGDPLATSAKPLQPPSSAYPLGTDQLGRDILARIVWGSRNSVLPALALVAITVAVGAAMGAIAAYFGRIVDEIVMRIADLLFAFPNIILAMAVVAVLGPSLRNAVIALAIVSWPAVARVVRGTILAQRDLDYVNASRLLGASSARVLLVDILPNMAGAIVVLAALDVGHAILTLAGLAFLGLGNTPPAPDWGAMVSHGTDYAQFWWMATFPGLAIFSIVAAFNFLGDALRDALDPKSSRSS